MAALESGSRDILSPAERSNLETLVAARLAHDKWTRPQLLARQRQQLLVTLRHAATASPYYRRLIGPRIADDIRLGDIPVLSKTSLMRHFDDIVTDRRLRLADIEAHLAGNAAHLPIFDDYRACATGGTSGERAIIVYDRAAFMVILANGIRFQRINGIGPSNRAMGIGSPSPLHLSNRIWNLLNAMPDLPRLYLTTPMPEIVAALNHHQPDFLFCYPSFLRRLAEEQQAGRLRIAPKQFRTGAEALCDDVHDLCREVWHAPVSNGYATTEAGVMGGGCPHVAGMHLTEDDMVVEVVDDAYRPVPAGDLGSRLLVTPLTNRLLPLLRYEVTDRLAVTEDICACGRPYARILRIEGRREEILHFRRRAVAGAEAGADDSPIEIHAGRLRTPLLRLAAVRQFQVAPSPDGLEIRLVLRDDAGQADGNSLCAAAEQAVRLILDEAGADIGSVTVRIVSDIARIGSGAKERLVDPAASFPR
ncbi:phenylacetate--CoA ligase family protein [Dongia soli]|uniref:Phenylacetate-coenzyme A ligase PaaK-like adenylate-forming protein n=1 Tax=Dongia soli TaxID=600628 RepID=A0ABU5EEG4_9PROT|nr:hypothetical protein [Dongia soli]MDY0884702.1 hypothetical protein [Dongia soli]